MDAELQKLVDSGKLTSKAAEQLEKLQPKTFCLHKSWGFGRVAEWNLLLNQIVIDFTSKKGHSMQLQYAADNVSVIPPEHFLAKKANDLAGTNDGAVMHFHGHSLLETRKPGAANAGRADNRCFSGGC